MAITPSSHSEKLEPSSQPRTLAVSRYEPMDGWEERVIQATAGTSHDEADAQPRPSPRLSTSICLNIPRTQAPQ